MPGKPYHGDVCVNECPNYGIMLSVFSWPGTAKLDTLASLPSWYTKTPRRWCKTRCGRDSGGAAPVRPSSSGFRRWPSSSRGPACSSSYGPRRPGAQAPSPCRWPRSFRCVMPHGARARLHASQRRPPRSSDSRRRARNTTPKHNRSTPWRRSPCTRSAMASRWSVMSRRASSCRRSGSRRWASTS